MKCDRSPGELPNPYQLVTLSLLLVISGSLSVPVASVLLSISVAVAQTTEGKKAEGDRLLERGYQQFQTR